MNYTVERLIALIPAGDPLRRLELFLAFEVVIGFMLKMPGKVVSLTVQDAARVQMAAKLRGVSIPLLSIRTAIERLMRAVDADQTHPEVTS